MDFPRVSIIIPVYNGSNYVQEAIDSALNQTYTNFEVIVVNDGSTDNGATEQIALSYGDRIRYFSKPNGGVATALNFGIEKMDGEYFSWLSHDDMYTPTKIEEEVRYLMEQPDKTTIVAEGYQVVNSSGEYLYTVNLHDQYAPERLKESMFLLLRGGINGCALLIHKSHFSRVGMFDPNLPTTQDYDLWFRMFRNQKVYYAASSNVLSRSHEEQGSKAMLDEHIKECDKLWIGMVDELTSAEKCDISGTELKFYQELWEFLRSVTGYTGAIAYTYHKIMVAALEEYRRTNKKSLLKVVADCCNVSADFVKKRLIPLANKKSHKPRVVFQLCSRNDKGGLNRIVVGNANMLAETYDVFIITWGEPYYNGYKSSDNVTELAVNYNQAEYVNMLLMLKTDIYVFSYCCGETVLSMLERVSAAGIKTIAWSHEDFFLPHWRESLRSCLPAREKYLPKADAVVWLNSTSQALYGLQHDNGICIPNHAGYVEISKPDFEKGNVLLAIGRYDDSQKGLGDLLRIFAQVQKHRPDTELYIVGGVDLQLPVTGLPGVTCGDFIKNEGITEQQLHLVGWTEDVGNYYQMAALHIMPSMYEGFGLVVLEAAAYGVPTVAYGGSGMQDIITNDCDGLITRRGDWEEMSKSVLKLLSDPKKIEYMQNNLPNMLERYSKENILQKWIELFDTILSGDAVRVRTYFRECQITDFKQAGARVLEEYERKNMMICPVQNVQYVPYYDDVWRQECLNMQSSLSWRITKPLRLIKKVMKSLHENGLKATLLKIKYKLQKK